MHENADEAEVMHENGREAEAEAEVEVVVVDEVESEAAVETRGSFAVEAAEAFFNNTGACR